MPYKDLELGRLKAKERYWQRRETILATMATPEYRLRRNTVRRIRYRASETTRALAKASSKRGWDKLPYWRVKFQNTLGKVRTKGAEVVDLRSLREFYRQVFSRADDVCIYCRGRFAIEDITIDHKQALARGGKHEVSNLAISCLACNMEKHAKPFETWIAQKESQ